MHMIIEEEEEGEGEGEEEEGEEEEEEDQQEQQRDPKKENLQVSHLVHNKLEDLRLIPMIFQLD